MLDQDDDTEVGCSHGSSLWSPHQFCLNHLHQCLASFATVGILQCVVYAGFFQDGGSYLRWPILDFQLFLLTSPLLFRFPFAVNPLSQVLINPTSGSNHISVHPFIHPFSTFYPSGLSLRRAQKISPGRHSKQMPKSPHLATLDAEEQLLW